MLCLFVFTATLKRLGTLGITIPTYPFPLHNWGGTGYKTSQPMSNLTPMMIQSAIVRNQLVAQIQSFPVMEFVKTVKKFKGKTTSWLGGKQVKLKVWRHLTILPKYLTLTTRTSRGAEDKGLLEMNWMVSASGDLNLSYVRRPVLLPTRVLIVPSIFGRGELLVCLTGTQVISL